MKKLKESEYFTLEANSWKVSEFKLRIQILEEKKLNSLKDAKLLQYQISERHREIEKCNDEIARLMTNIENVGIAVDEFKSSVNKRVKLPKDSKWGYNPETLEILVD